MSPTDKDLIRDTVMTMGADQVLVGNEGNTVFVAFYRHGGCGKIIKNVCSFLRNKLPDNQIIVTHMTKRGDFCKKAQIREKGAKHFHGGSVQVTASRLGLA